MHIANILSTNYIKDKVDEDIVFEEIVPIVEKNITMTKEKKFQFQS